MKVTNNELNNLISWTRAYFVNNKIERAVIGVSGGIDSAVVTSILVKALGVNKVIPVILPCESKEQDQIDAQHLCNELHINPLVYDLTKTFNVFREETNEKTQPINVVARGNAKARLRMTTLYDVANRTGSLVVGTTNKTEAMIGYATKYGDGGVDIEPLQDFYKTEIFDLAKLLGDIPKAIIEKAPSAGLWENQTDEEELGMTYEVIDSYLKNTGSVLSTNPIFNKIQKMVIANKHKDLHLPSFKRTTK
jgi:NAD+ synthase